MLLVSQKEEMKLKAIQQTEKVLIDVDGGIKEKYPLNDNELIPRHPSHADLCNKTEFEGNEKIPHSHKGSASVNVR